MIREKLIDKGIGEQTFSGAAGRLRGHTLVTEARYSNSAERHRLI